VDVLKYCRRVQRSLEELYVEHVDEARYWRDRGLAHRAECLAWEGFEDAARERAEAVAEEWGLVV